MREGMDPKILAGIKRNLARGLVVTMLFVGIGFLDSWSFTQIFALIVFMSILVVGLSIAAGLWHSKKALSLLWLNAFYIILFKIIDFPKLTTLVDVLVVIVLFNIAFLWPAYLLGENF